MILELRPGWKITSYVTIRGKKPPNAGSSHYKGPRMETKMHRGDIDGGDTPL